MSTCAAVVLLFFTQFLFSLSLEVQYVLVEFLFIIRSLLVVSAHMQPELEIFVPVLNIAVLS